MPRVAPRSLHRLAAVLLVLLPLVALGAATAATRPKVENPHGRFRGECDLCHGPEGWKPARISPRFDHSKSGFTLAGAHAAASCMGCHRSLDFASSSTLCASCHEDPHRSEMGTECARCHSARSFVDRGPMLRAHQLTLFPLTGSHAAIDCEGCHRPASQGQMRFVNTQAECRSCHMDEFQATKAPDHVAGGFSTECQVCHSTTLWSRARFDHARSGFPLTGAHRTTACESCHVGGRYSGTPRDCFSCHADDYDRAQPPHASSGFAAAACASCHSTTNWSGASFDHSRTSFPLTGAHRAAACMSCHADGVFDGKPTDCASCHMGNYNSATPDHAAAGFAASACASCHNTTTWAGATFDHDGKYFRIYRGGHAGRWGSCSDCHQVASNYASFTCLTCHPHSDKAKTDATHSGRGGYRYDSNSCYSCHTR